MTDQLHIGTSMTHLRIIAVEQAEAIRIARERREHLLMIARRRKQPRVTYLFSGFKKRWLSAAAE